MPNIESRHRRIHKSTSEIAYTRYTDKLIWNVVVKKLRFETLKNSNILTSAGRSFQELYTRLENVCLKILILHLFGIIVGESEDLKGVLHLLPQIAPKLTCSVLYLKIINIFLKHNVCIL